MHPRFQTSSAEPAQWSAHFVCTPGEWPDIESAAEKDNDYFCQTLERACEREDSRALSRFHDYKTCAQLTALLKRYGLPSSGRRAVLLARVTGHEATLVSPPFVAVTETFSFEFLKLPNEIRNMVYKELLTLEDDHCARVARVVSILGANKQIYSEAKGLLYSLNTIKIKIDDLDRLWLRYPRPPFDISISRKQHYSDKDRTKGLAPPIQWLELPTYLGRCEKIKIVLSIKGTFWQHFTPAKLKTMLVHFNSLVYTKLMKHEYLHTIHMELELTEEYNAQLTSTVTDRQMLSFEQGCLNSLCRLRGMLMVHLKGFRFIDPFDVFLVKRTMLLPSSMWWSSFFAIPKMMQAVPQWWQLRNLSIHCNPSGHYVATTHNLGDVTFIAFQRLPWRSLTRARRLQPQTLSLQSYHASMSRWHLIMLTSLLQSPLPLPALAPSIAKRRTLDSHEALVRY